jgi:hypothetical protein
MTLRGSSTGADAEAVKDEFDNMFDEVPTPAPGSDSGVKPMRRFPDAQPRRLSVVPQLEPQRLSTIPPSSTVLLPKAKLIENGYDSDFIRALESFCSTLQLALLKDSHLVLGYSLSNIVEVISDQKGVQEFDRFLTILEATIIKYLKVKDGTNVQPIDRAGIVAFRKEYALLKATALRPVPGRATMPSISDAVAARVSAAVPFAPYVPEAPVNIKPAFGLPENVLTGSERSIPADIPDDQKLDLEKARKAVEKAQTEKTLDARLEARYAALAAGVHQKPLYQPSSPTPPAPKKSWWKRAVDAVKNSW